jgi:hypothetical protein
VAALVTVPPVAEVEQTGTTEQTALVREAGPLLRGPSTAGLARLIGAVLKDGQVGS